MTLCIRCSHPANSHSPYTGYCTVAGEGFVCDCTQLVDGETVVAFIEPEDAA